MEKVVKKIKKGLHTLKLNHHKIVTNMALKLVTRKKISENISVCKDIFYGKNKLQSYDILFCNEDKNKRLPVMFYIHGGAWCSGDKYGYNDFCSKICEHGFVCVNINYRLMPKVQLSTTVSDCINAIKTFCNKIKIIEKKLNIVVDLNKVFMTGDSAGAHLVSLIAGKQTTGKIKLPIKILGLGLYYGVFDLNNLENDPSPILQDLNNFWQSTNQNSKQNYKKLSPTTYVTNNYPPCFITSGEIDKLNYQTAIFEHLLTLNQIEHDYLSFDKSRQDGRHAFLNMPILNSAKEAFERLTKFFEKQLNKG